MGKNFTIADAAFAPMFWRIEIILKHNIGLIQENEAKRILDKYQGVELGKLREYFETIKTRKSFKEIVMDEVSSTALIHCRKREKLTYCKLLCKEGLEKYFLVQLQPNEA